MRNPRVRKKAKKRGRGLIKMHSSRFCCLLSMVYVMFAEEMPKVGKEGVNTLFPAGLLHQIIAGDRVRAKGLEERSPPGSTAQLHLFGSDLSNLENRPEGVN